MQQSCKYLYWDSNASCYYESMYHNDTAIIRTTRPVFFLSASLRFNKVLKQLMFGRGWKDVGTREKAEHSFDKRCTDMMQWRHEEPVNNINFTDSIRVVPQRPGSF